MFFDKSIFKIIQIDYYNIHTKYKKTIIFKKECQVLQYLVLTNTCYIYSIVSTANSVSIYINKLGFIRSNFIKSVILVTFL